MKAIAIKMKSYTGGINIVNNNNMQACMLNILLLSFGIFAFIYVLFLGNMVFNIVERKSLETNARVLSSEVGKLELAYLSISNKIDLTFSYSLGFTEAKAKFATRKSLGNLKLANNEI